jgi:glutaredoxin
MGEKKVIVYSAEWCPWCHKAIDFLKENKIEHEVRDVGQNPDYAKEVQEKSGQTGIPVILIDDEVIIGFNQPKLKEALGLEEKKEEEKGEEEKSKEKKEEEKKEESSEKEEGKEEKKEEGKESDSSYA